MPLRTIPIALDQLALVAAGPTEPLLVWEEQQGRRTLTDRQETDPETGERLWTAYLMPVGTDRPEVLSVRVRAEHQPTVTQFAPVTLDHLEVNVRVGRDGKLAQYFSGRGLRDAAHGAKRQHAEANAS